MPTPSAASIVLPISLFSSWECLQSDTYSCKPWTSVGRDKELSVTPLQFLWCCYTPAMLRQQVWWSECLIRFKCNFHFALTDPTLPAINYTVLDRCLLLKANKQCNWLSKIFNAGHYTSCSGGETTWILVGGGWKCGCLHGLLFWMNTIFFFKL